MGHLNMFVRKPSAPIADTKILAAIERRDAENSLLQSQLAAISRSLAVIEFAMDGTILTANDNFLSTVGYALDEIQGQHHSMFVEPDFARSGGHVGHRSVQPPDRRHHRRD